MMAHLRIVTPPDRTEAVIALLEQSPAVTNLIALPGAARKPHGDVVLCDVAREAASIVLSDLRVLEIPAVGSIAVEHVDTELSATAEAAERASPGTPSTAVVWEEVEELTSESTELTGSFLLFMALATIIAAVGIFLDTPILIIGAMVIGPEFGPLASLCVAAIQRRRSLALRSLTALAVGFPVGIAAALGVSLLIKWFDLAPEEFTQTGHSLADVISSPDLFSFLVAFCAGIAGMLSLTTAKSGALVGVLISITTIPAAANVGVATAYGDWSSCRGSLLQLGLNLGTLVVAGLLTLALQRRAFARRAAASG